MAGYNPGRAIPDKPTPTPIQEADSDTLTILADVDGDGRLDRVAYELRDTRLVREIASWNGTSFSATSSSEIAGGIVGLSFGYFDDTGDRRVHEVELPALELDATFVMARDGRPSQRAVDVRDGETGPARVVGDPRVGERRSGVEDTDAAGIVGRDDGATDGQHV